MKEQIPTGWVDVPLGEVAFPRVDRSEPGQAGDMQYLGLEHVEAQYSRIVGSVRASTMKSTCLRFSAGDVLYGRLRPYLNKVAMPQANGLCSPEFIVFPEHDWLANSFLRYRLNSRDFVSYAAHLDAGDRPRVDFDQLSPFRLHLPPIKEQGRIAAKVDELFFGLDAGVTALQRAQAKLKRYRASVLKAAVEGRLTAEWRRQNPPTESGPDLLARLLRERRARWEQSQLAKFTANDRTPPKDWREKYAEPVAPDTSTLPVLPEGWCWASIGQCFRVHLGATPSRAEASYWNGDIPWVSSGEVRFCEIQSTREHITPAALANSSTQINPAGSVLLGMIGEGKTRGQAAVLRVPACNNQNCAAIWVSETDVPPEFMYAWLYSQYDATRRVGSGNNQPALNKALVEAMCFPLAPICEQLQIVEILEAALDASLRAENGIRDGLNRSAGLRQATLKHAFSGKLVPQDPNDEPASILLERIRATRAAAPVKARAPRKSAARGKPPAPASAIKAAGAPRKRGRPRRAPG